MTRCHPQPNASQGTFLIDVNSEEERGLLALSPHQPKLGQLTGPVGELTLTKKPKVGLGKLIQVRPQISEPLTASCFSPT